MNPSPRDRWLRRARAHGPWLLVTVVALWLLWPVPLGHAPLSADHTVHLTRIWMWSDALASGQLRGWSSTWFLGTPVGELYPVLGDLIVIAVRVLSLGLLDWHQSYAIGLTLAFVIPAWCMVRAGRALGLGPIPGIVAGVLLLVDAGAYREGGWTYTMTFGVWPQHLSTGLTWLGLSELAVACTSDDPQLARRRIATGALATGGALLAHPMAMLGFAIGGPLLVLVVGPRPWSNLRPTVARALVGGALGLAVAAWWVGPMLAHRGWMASYGWLWQPLRWMAEEASEGRWAQHMPEAVGMTVSLGLVALAVVGGRRGRFFGAYALVMWLLAAKDTVWALRLDLVSEGFTHLQYQRFLTAAKPGLWLAAGFAVGGLAELGRRTWRSRWPNASLARPLAVALGVGAVGLAGWIVADTRPVMDEHDVGRIQLTRANEASPLDDEYPQVVQWLHERWAARADGEYWRVTVDAPRNLHWFMDLPVLTGAPLYKEGFTPGDNFVHKPESAHPKVLDAARVRYVVASRRRGGRGQVVAEFGDLRILERPDATALPLAWLDGPGTVEVLEAGEDGAPVRVRVSGTDGPTRLTFAISGYPRWSVTHDGNELQAYEVPIFTMAKDGSAPAVATYADRRGGLLRGGKAEGDDGTEPTLLAVDVTDGEVVLEYHSRTLRDVLYLLASVVALAIIGVLWWPVGRVPARVQAWSDKIGAGIDRLRPLGHGAIVAGLVVVLAVGVVLKVRRGRVEESTRAFGHVLDSHAQTQGARADYLKAGMLIRPAVVIDRRRNGPAVIALPNVTLTDTLTGWYAIDDDAAKLRRNGAHRLRIVARTSAGEVVLMPDRPVLHRAGLVPLSIDTSPWAGQTVQLQVVVESTGKSPPPLGFDLQLEATP
mgnify:CR=1 FL=1